MKKLSFALLLFTALGIYLSLGAFCKAAYVHDEADVLTSDEELLISNALSSLSKEYSMDFAVATTKNVSYDALPYYADNLYDTSGYGDDGLIILINAQTGDRYISTCGKACGIFDAKLNRFSSSAGTYFENGLYAKGFLACADTSKDILDSRSFSAILSAVAISVIIGLIIAFITTGIMKGALNTVASCDNASGYIKQGSFNITRSNDFFLYSTVSRRKKPQNNSSRSSSRSGGRSHGGGRF